jgi:hypothetical protein
MDNTPKPPAPQSQPAPHPAPQPHSAALTENRPTLKLSPQQFGAILDSLRTSQSTGGSDKRRFNRMEIEAKLVLINIADGHLTKAFIGLTRDISINGIGLLLHAPQPRGQTFLACLPHNHGKDELLVVCRSTFSRGLAEGIYGIGAEFSSLADGQLAAERAKMLADPHIPPAAAAA